MDIFTDVDIFKEIVDASIRGVAVYVLLNDLNLKSFLTMAENQDVKIQQLRVSTEFQIFSSFSFYQFDLLCLKYILLTQFLKIL